ncbi:MAG: Crp/Fnr family transcriptional regulator [Betaproteobacteria bacterium]|nr:Crp/Fnr family transcriptional regulator [Betaproteobacteria bacterium]
MDVPAVRALALMSNTAPRIQCEGRSNCSACALRDKSVCRDIFYLQQHTEFDSGIDDCRCAHGSTLYSIAAPVDALYCIREGVVKLAKPWPGGEQRIVRVLKSGDIAEIEAIYSPTFEHTASAIGEVRACRIPIAWLRRFAAASWRLQTRLLNESVAALRETETWHMQLTGEATPARTRVARLMLRLRADARDCIHRFSLEDMGAVIGVAPETVSRIISDFGRQGILVKTDCAAADRGCFRGDIPALEKIALEFRSNPPAIPN